MVILQRRDLNVLHWESILHRSVYRNQQNQRFRACWEFLTYTGPLRDHHKPSLNLSGGRGTPTQAFLGCEQYPGPPCSTVTVPSSLQFQGFFQEHLLVTRGEPETCVCGGETFPPLKLAHQTPERRVYNSESDWREALLLVTGGWCVSHGRLYSAEVALNKCLGLSDVSNSISLNRLN